MDTKMEADMSTPTNPEQVCPGCLGKGKKPVPGAMWSEINCPTCHGTGKVAANDEWDGKSPLPPRTPEQQAAIDKYGPVLDAPAKPDSDFRPRQTLESPDQAPADPPDELEQLLYGEHYQSPEDGPDGLWVEDYFLPGFAADLRALITREREAAYKRGRDDEHWECDPRHISAALTKGETNG